MSIGQPSYFKDLTLPLNGLKSKKAGRVVIPITGSLHFCNRHKIASKQVKDPLSKEEQHSEAKELFDCLKEVENALENPLKLYSVVKNLLNKDSNSALVTLTSDAIQQFIENYFASTALKLYPSLRHFNDINLIILPDAFAIPYDEKRDSIPIVKEDFENEPRALPKWVYDNRQKLRDGFLLLLKEFIPQKKFTERNLALRCKDILFSKASHLNGDWLAELFVGEYLRWCRPHQKKGRLEQLERRFQSSTEISPDECTELFASIIKLGDCLSLTRELKLLIPRKISQLEELCCNGSLRRNENFKNSVFRISGLVQLYKVVDAMIGNDPQPILQNLIFQAAEKKCLLLHLKWAANEWPKMYESSVFGAKANGLLSIIFGKEIGSNEEHLSEKTLNGKYLDSDNSLDLSFIIEEIFPHLNLNYSIIMNNIKTPPARKVQPITSEFSQFGQYSLIQRELRQWFWWQRPHEYELVKSLVSYIKEKGFDSTVLKATLSGMITKLSEEEQNMLILLAYEEFEKQLAKSPIPC